MADTIQFWLALIVCVAGGGFTCFMIGMFLGIRIGRTEDYKARDALGVSNGGSGVRARR